MCCLVQVFPTVAKSHAFLVVAPGVAPLLVHCVPEAVVDAAIAADIYVIIDAWWSRRRPASHGIDVTCHHRASGAKCPACRRHDGMAVGLPTPPHTKQAEQSQSAAKFVLAVLQAGTRSLLVMRTGTTTMPMTMWRLFRLFSVRV